MKKKLKLFKDKYGDIPNDFIERFDYILNKTNLSDKELSKLRLMILNRLNCKWNTLEFVINFFPMATPRPRQGKNGRFYVKGSMDNSKLFRKFLEEGKQNFNLITTGIKIRIDNYFPIPESMNKYEKILSELKLIRPVSKPDWDNLGKTYSDMIQNNLILDDSLIIEGLSRKFYSFKPRIEIKISYMEKYDSKFNKRRIESWKSYKNLFDNILEKDSL